MKETYKVKCPGRFVFGDPDYFQEYEGERLRKLVVDVLPPSYFTARVALEVAPVKDYPQYTGRVMTIIMAPERTIKTYLQGMRYESQDMLERDICVDSASYQIIADGRGEVFYPGGEGYWGSYVEYSRSVSGKRFLDGIMIGIHMPEDCDMDQMRRYLHYFFEEVEQVENVEMPEPLDEPEPEAGPGNEPAIH